MVPAGETPGGAGGRDRTVKEQGCVSTDSKSKVSKQCLLRGRAREGEGVGGVTPRTEEEWKACCNSLRIVWWTCRGRQGEKEESERGKKGLQVLY